MRVQSDASGRRVWVGRLRLRRDSRRTLESFRIPSASHRSGLPFLHAFPTLLSRDSRYISESFRIPAPVGASKAAPQWRAKKLAPNPREPVAAMAAPNSSTTPEFSPRWGKPRRVLGPTGILNESEVIATVEKTSARCGIHVRAVRARGRLPAIVQRSAVELRNRGDDPCGWACKVIMTSHDSSGREQDVPLGSYGHDGRDRSARRTPNPAPVG